MRVAIDGRAIGSGAGGDESYTRGLLSGLRQVAGETDTFPVFLSPEIELPSEIAGDGRFPVSPLRARSQLVRYAIDMPRALRSLQPAAELVHCINYAPPRSPVPIALQVADLSFRHHPSLYKVDTRVRLNALVPFLIRRASVVLTVSEFSRRDIIDTYRVAAERVFVIPNVVEVAAPDEPAADRARRLDELGVQRPYFVYVGNLHPRKNIARLIRAFVIARNTTAVLKDHRLVIAGARWWGGGDVQTEAGKAPPGFVKFLGRVSDGDRDRLLLEAEALLYPSIFEGFGLPPLEAMAMGVPVLSSTSSALPEVLGDAALLVDPYDVDAMAAGIVSLGTDERLRERLARAGRVRAARYTARAMGERALEAFRWAVGDGRRLARG